MNGEQLFMSLVPMDWDVVGEVPLTHEGVEPVEAIAARGKGDWDIRFFKPPLGSNGGTPIAWPTPEECWWPEMTRDE